MYIRNCEKIELVKNVSFKENQSVMFWIKLDNIRNKREVIITAGQCYKFSIVIEKSESNQISFYCGDHNGLPNGDALYKSYTGRLPYNKFQHVTFVRNTNGVKVYINCKLIRSYIFDFHKLDLTDDDIQFGSSNHLFLENLSEPIKDFRIIDQELNELEILQYAKIFFKNYYTSDYSVFSYMFNMGDWNYKFKYNDYNYIYNENILVKYKQNTQDIGLFESIIKFNYLSNEEKNLLLENTSFNISDINNDPNIDLYVSNILTWQFGMYQDSNPKNIPNDATGFWPVDITNFFIPYTKIEDLRSSSYKGTTQEGVGTYIKIIIDYYLNNQHSPDKKTQLVMDCLQSIKLFIGFLNKMIYDNGGVPLYYPLSGRTSYHNMITLNDCAMINYIRCCEYILNSDVKNKIDSHDISLLEVNYNKSINCLLNLQYVINGKKTIWPQQADSETLLPTKGRSFEIESICSLESVQILIYLMSLLNQTDKIKDAIVNGCEWFKTHSISGYKQYKVNGNIVISKTNNNVNLLWSRYYSLDNQTPVFFDRDGNTYNLDTFNNIPSERRNGYNWLGIWGYHLLEIYDKWKLLQD